MCFILMLRRYDILVVNLVFCVLSKSIRLWTDICVLAESDRDQYRCLTLEEEICYKYCMGPCSWWLLWQYSLNALCIWWDLYFVCHNVVSSHCPVSVLSGTVSFLCVNTIASLFSLELKKVHILVLTSQRHILCIGI